MKWLQIAIVVLVVAPILAFLPNVIFAVAVMADAPISWDESYVRCIYLLLCVYWTARLIR